MLLVISKMLILTVSLFASRKERSPAITATARKLAIIIWNMVLNRQEYKPINPYELLDEKRKRIVREMQKKIAEFDIQTNASNLDGHNLE
jgi:hypothetical protein